MSDALHYCDERSLKEIKVFSDDLDRHIEVFHNSIHFDIYRDWKMLDCNLCYMEKFKIVKTKLQPLNIERLVILDSCIVSEPIKYLEDWLGTNNTIKELYILQNLINDEGAKHISNIVMENKCIENLDLTTNNITSEGAKYIAKALEHNTTIEMLSLSRNFIKSEGVKYLSDMLKVNKSLKCLNLGICKIGSLGICHIADMLKINTTLIDLIIPYNKYNIKYDSIIRLANALKVNTTLKILSISMDSKYINEFVDNIFKLNYTLKELRITHGDDMFIKFYINRNKRYRIQYGKFKKSFHRLLKVLNKGNIHKNLLRFLILHTLIKSFYLHPTHQNMLIKKI